MHFEIALLWEFLQHSLVVVFKNDPESDSCQAISKRRDVARERA